jgi:hypothetical protein
MSGIVDDSAVVGIGSIFFSSDVDDMIIVQTMLILRLCLVNIFFGLWLRRHCLAIGGSAQ